MTFYDKDWNPEYGSESCTPTTILSLYINNLYLFFDTSAHSFVHKKKGVVRGNSKVAACNFVLLIEDLAPIWPTKKLWL